MDEASLLFSTMAIRSMSDEKLTKVYKDQFNEARLSIKAAAVTPEQDLSVDAVADKLSSASLISEASSFESFGIEEVRYLMHWIRAELSLYFADVNYILGNPKGHQVSSSYHGS